MVPVVSSLPPTNEMSRCFFFSTGFSNNGCALPGAFKSNGQVKWNRFFLVLGLVHVPSTCVETGLRPSCYGDSQVAASWNDIERSSAVLD